MRVFLGRLGRFDGCDSVRFLLLGGGRSKIGDAIRPTGIILGLTGSGDAIRFEFDERETLMGDCIRLEMDCEILGSSMGWSIRS